MASDRHRPVDALRVPGFRGFAVSSFFLALAETALDATVAWQVFQLTDSPFALGVLGVVRFVPSLLLSLVAGATADSYDRRALLLVSKVVLLASALGLLVASRGETPLVVLYALVLLNTLGAIFHHPTHNALLPLVVPERLLSEAITIDTSAGSIAWVTGPLGAGALIAVFGISETYLASTIAFAISLAALVPVRAVREQGERSGVSVRAVREGLSFVFHRQVLLGAMTLDLLAVIFGGAAALLPIYADEILKVGPTGYGVLASSINAGGALMGIALLFAPPIRRAGPALLLAVAFFGLGTIVFGLSRSFLLSLVAYGFLGAADQVSVVIRHMMVPMLTPPELQGRVGSVNLVFINASNQLGSAESGFLAGVTSPTFAVVSGGIACLAALGVIAVAMPALRAFRIVTPAREVTVASGASGGAVSQE